MGQLEQPRLNKNLIYQRDEPKEPSKEGPLSFVLFESPFTSVLTVSRGHYSLVSLDSTVEESMLLPPSPLFGYITENPSDVAKTGKQPVWYTHMHTAQAIYVANLALFMSVFYYSLQLSFCDCMLI
jgi:hypothetical protein